MKISVITVCYNAEQEIKRTVDSVLCQDFEDMEYIVVDGGSSDDTVAIAKNALELCKGTKSKIISEPDRGIYDAMNKGIKYSSGEWVCMMNAGDMFASNDVLSTIFNMNIPNNVSFIFSDFYKSTSFGRYFRVSTCCTEHKKILVHQSIIYKKKLHEQYGYYAVTPQIIISDLLFFLQIPVNETLKVEKVIAIYEGSGISEQGSWCEKQGICANVVFRHQNFWNIYLEYFKWKVKHFVPLRLREWIRLKTTEVTI